MDDPTRGDIDDSPFAEIDAKLQEVASCSPTATAWHEAWLRLGPESLAEQRLAVCQTIRRSGVLPEAASFWLVSHLIDDIAARDADADLLALF